jgi:hypothetical protein
MKLTFATKYEAVQALMDIEVDPPRMLLVYPEGSYHVPGGRPWDYTLGTGRYFVTDCLYDGNHVAVRKRGKPFDGHKYVWYSSAERRAAGLP